MANKNFLLHGSTGKVGSVVTYSRGGKQIVRALAAQVANPRTASQSNTRALFAPAAKFYSPLAVVLEKSFEGLNKSNSHSAFMKRAISDAFANGWYLPKGTGFFPLPYLVSKGTVMPIITTFNTANGELRTQLKGMTVSTSVDDFDTVGGLSEFFIEQGYAEGDQITFIGVVRDDEGQYYPIADRFLLNSESTILIEDAIPHFEFSPNDKEIGWVVSSEFETVAGTVIVSRYENKQWRRTNSRLVVSPEIMDAVTSAEGRDAAITSYMDGNSTVQSDVYLNGSTGVNGGSAVNSLALSDGSAVTPIRLVQVGSMLYVEVQQGEETKKVAAALSDGLTRPLNYITSRSTKGTWPEGETAPTVYIEALRSEWKQTLQNLGVAASVFQ